jgi:S1-C subfamily serine protease
MSTLNDLSNALAAAVETAGASVVRVEARRRIPASGIVWSADDVIVTAHHVVEQDENIGIGLPDGRSATAALVGRDPTTDLAVLRLQDAPAGGLRTAAWLDADQLKVGHLALALGRPGHHIMATMGIVSALRADWRTPAGGQVDHYLQSDVVMYPGFSGGPLVSAEGQILGINTSALPRDVSLTIPTGTVRRVVETLLRHGRVRRGYLGVGAQVVRLPANLAKQLDQETGLLLGSVEPDSPAEHNGLFIGDTIVALAGQSIRHLDDLLALLSGDRIGSVVPIRIVRGGQVTDLQVVIGEQS